MGLNGLFIKGIPGSVPVDPRDIPAIAVWGQRLSFSLARGHGTSTFLQVSLRLPELLEDPGDQGDFKVHRDAAPGLPANAVPGDEYVRSVRQGLLNTSSGGRRGRP